MALPKELIMDIMYKFGGLEHPTAKLMKPVIRAVTEMLHDCISDYVEPPDWDEYYSAEFRFESFAFNRGEYSNSFLDRWVEVEVPLTFALTMHRGRSLPLRWWIKMPKPAPTRPMFEKK